MRIIASAVLGGVLGYERERAEKPAGLRTHMIVCVASALMMLLSIHISGIYAGQWFDPARIAAQVISGMGFLGAGTIIRQGSIVRGLTTAASLWFVAGVGLAIGAGFYFASIVAVAIVLVLFFVNMDKVLGIRRASTIEIRHIGGGEVTSRVIREVLGYDFDLGEITTERQMDGRTLIEVRLTRPADKENISQLMSGLKAIAEVTGVSITE